ncbi:MAG: hypothetical protein GX974_00360 [Clostridiales bacterium]|nr:hypothetical protein [Clostridiales bacterium]
MGLELIAMNLGWLMIAFFILGTTLIAIEIIVPGFGIAGVLGIISLIIGLRLAYGLVAPAVLIMLIAIILVVITALVIWFYRSITRDGRLSKILVLKSQPEAGKTHARVEDKRPSLNQQGRALTMLRPTGTVEFDGEKFDVITEGESIPAGTIVEVIKKEGFKIIVREIENHS